MLAIPALYGHCPPAVQGANAARLCPQAIAKFTQPLTGGAWRRFPSTFVRCLDDRAIALNHQDAMAARCTHVTAIDTDHSPFASAVAATADVLEPFSRA